MTNLHLQILLHYACSGVDWDCRTPTHTEYRENLSDDGLLEQQTQGGPYRITDKGLFHVEHLLAHPLPQKTWTYVEGVWKSPSTFGR